jgi:predicted metalloprotease with PDZ domain
MRPRVVFQTLVAAAILAAAAAPAQAQRWVEPEERGWIGISFQVDTDRWGRTSNVLVTDVSPGSPADEAGLRPGDRLVAINDLDSPEELRELTRRLRLGPGDPVVMEVERAGERRRLRLRAAARPQQLEFPSRVEYAFSTNDDQVETWVRSMDSLKVELVQMDGSNFRVRTSGEGEASSVTVVTTMGRGSVEAPFEFFVFRGEAHDSLKGEMIELNRAMRDLERELATREREVRARTRSADPLHLASDERFRDLSLRLDEMARRSQSLEAAMAAEAREAAGRDYVAPRVRLATTVDAPEAAAAPETAEPEFRPLMPYLLGRNRVAGAQVVDLKPELAQYFEVDGGVLVVDVASGTPAGLAGIVPGDVIVRIDQVAIRSVDDLRFGVSMAGDTLPVTLIRKGETAQVLLRR